MECLFCDFLSGKISEHAKGFPFIINHETENTLSFLSMDSPVNNEAHMLVIPRGHFASFHDMPNEVLLELAKHLSVVGKFYSKKGNGYNLLFNNGSSAGQSVHHAHFHVIPRKKKDGIKIEVWKRSKFSSKSFINLSNKTKSEFKDFIKDHK